MNKETEYKYPCIRYKVICNITMLKFSVKLERFFPPKINYVSPFPQRGKYSYSRVRVSLPLSFFPPVSIRTRPHAG